MVRIVLFGILVVGGITSVVLQDREKRGFTLVLFVVGTVMFEIFTNYLSDWMRPVFFGPDPAASASASVSAELTRTGEDTGPVQADVKPVELDSQGSGQTSSPAPAPAPSPAPAPAPAPEESDPLSQLEDISGQTSVSGSVLEKGRKDQYLYTPSVDGIYLFETGLSFNSAVWVEVDHLHGGKVQRNTSRVSVDLTAGKTYILTVEYVSTPQDYTVEISVPNPVEDITGLSSVSGQLTYYSQRNRYLYTAPADGTYQLGTGLGFNAGIWIEVGDEKGRMIKRMVPTLTIDLTGGRTYTVSVYTGRADYTRDYTLQIETVE